MRTRVVVSYSVASQGSVSDADELADHLDAILDVLMDEPDIIEPELNATLAEGTVEIVLVLETEDELEAVQRGTTAVRAAINSAGEPSQSAMAQARFEVTAEPSALSA